MALTTILYFLNAGNYSTVAHYMEFIEWAAPLILPRKTLQRIGRLPVDANISQLIRLHMIKNFTYAKSYVAQEI